jgi:hypothetical protein
MSHAAMYCTQRFAQAQITHYGSTAVWRCSEDGPRQALHSNSSAVAETQVHDAPVAIFSLLLGVVNSQVSP